MLFQTPLFFVFFAGVLALLVALPGRTSRQALLLAASYAFYGTWNWRFLGLILLSTAIDYAVGLALGRTPRRPRLLLVTSVVANLGILGVFKYFDFFARSAAELLATLGVQLHPVTLDVVLPVGISFYTFQSLSYTVDVYRGTLTPERSFLRFALYVAFFPQLVAGPIVRARDFLPQLERDGRPRGRDLAPGLFLFAVGLFKKIVLSDHVARVSDRVFEEHATMPPWIVAFGVVCYAFQIYLDFSGYSDMAIGSARILGFRIPRNFRLPYLATSPRDFWRRWHISLSTWLRDYLYIPLGGNRGSRLSTAKNLLVTMLLGGLWHGANWTFVAWGAWHGVLLGCSRRLERWPVLITWPFTFVAVLVGWILFRATSLRHAWSLVASPWSGPRIDPIALPLLPAAVAVALAVLGHLSVVIALERRVRRSDARLRALAAGALIAAAFVLSPGTTRPFIYFQF